MIFNAWNGLFPLLMEAQTEDDVIKCLEVGLPGRTELVPYPALILRILKDKYFPKTKQAQVNFLADSLAGMGLVTPRSSRDICAKDRRSGFTHYIVRFEVYIECTCGFKGRSESLACRKCGARLHPQTFQGYL